MHRLRKIGWIFAQVVVIFLLLIAFGLFFIRQASIMDVPTVTDKRIMQQERLVHPDGLMTLQSSWFRKSESGLYEMYVSGNAFDRGVINGKLSKELVVRQEQYFGEQIYKLIPSKFTRGYLKDLIGWFNKDLDKYIKPEFKEEIYGISFAASNEFDFLGPAYQRLLNYHAAHDIGHAVQNLAMVGCTSFGTWNDRSSDSSLIIGRNFDFYAGDKFSEDKLIAFFKPDEGYKFMTITWGGFIGAVSGMNDQGLTVTINAAKSDLPVSSAVPVSLVAREILQYAKNIREAVAIARKRKMFVSESFLIGSAIDNKAIIIEKTPDSMDVYESSKNYIICSNHFQSNGLASSEKNREHLKESASSYRFQRVEELLQEVGPNTVEKSIEILRNRRGLHQVNIGEGNEKAINQLIAHHSVVFKPQELKVWVSTEPWQLGAYVCYDLNKVFAMHGMKTNQPVAEASLTVAADSFLYSTTYSNFILFRKIKQDIADGKNIDPEQLISSNPNFYLSYLLAGDYLFKLNENSRALTMYQKALTKEIASTTEEKHIREQIRILESK